MFAVVTACCALAVQISNQLQQCILLVQVHSFSLGMRGLLGQQCIEMLLVFLAALMC